MGIFRRRRRSTDAQREARWRKTQEIVNGLFPHRGDTVQETQESEHDMVHPLRPLPRDAPPESQPQH